MPTVWILDEYTLGPDARGVQYCVDGTHYAYFMDEVLGVSVGRLGPCRSDHHNEPLAQQAEIPQELLDVIVGKVEPTPSREESVRAWLKKRGLIDD